MLMIPAERPRGMGAVSSLVYAPGVVTGSFGPLPISTARIVNFNNSPALLQAPVIGSQLADSQGNIYVYTSAGWTLQSSAVSPTVPTTATPAPTSGSTFPSNPVVGQQYTDPAGNVWTYTATGWQEGAAAATSAGSSAASWLGESTIISSVPNYVLAGAAVFALIFLFKKR